MEVPRNGKKTKFDLGLTCSKYLLFVLNVVFAILSVVTISGAISSLVAFNSYSSLMYNGFQMFSTFWLVVGIIFMLVALFGIFVAFKESTVLANLYGFAMMVVFIFQVSAAIAGFTLISRSRYMVSEQLDTMMRFYSGNHGYYDYYYDRYNYNFRLEVDWIQSKFECCGKNGPSDWQNYDKFATTTRSYWDLHPTTPYWYRQTETPYYWDRETTTEPPPADDYYNNYYGPTTTTGYADTISTTMTTTTTTEAPRTDLMPASCCVQYSNYVNLTCEKHHTSGCFEPIHQIVSESIMMIGSSALVFAVIQIFGIVLGFLYARIIRHKKTQRNIQIWNSGQEYSSTPEILHQPVHVDYSPIDN